MWLVLLIAFSGSCGKALLLPADGCWGGIYRSRNLGSLLAPAFQPLSLVPPIGRGPAGTVWQSIGVCGQSRSWKGGFGAE